LANREALRLRTEDAANQRRAARSPTAGVIRPHTQRRDPRQLGDAAAPKVGHDPHTTNRTPLKPPGCITCVASGDKCAPVPFGLAPTALCGHARSQTDFLNYENHRTAASNGKEPLFTPEHALHVVEIITAARESQAGGKHVKLASTLKWPVVE
jgi:hypothetical protein